MHFIRKSEIPAFMLLLPFLAGIATGLLFPHERATLFLSYSLTLLAALFIGLYFAYNPFKLHRFPLLGGCLVHGTLFLAGWLCLLQNVQINQQSHFARHPAKYMLVRLTSEAKQSGQFFRYTGEVTKAISQKVAQQVTGKLLLTIVADSNSMPVAYGDMLLLPATYKTIDPPFNPAEFNYKQYLAHQNIYHQSFFTQRQVLCVAHNQGNPMVGYALRLRQQMVQIYKRNLPDAQAAAVASTLILGYKADLSPDVLQAYSKTGTIHVLSVSGAHVAIIFWFISLLVAPVKRHRLGKWFGALLSLLLIWGYALLTGFSPAVCRAALMISFVIIGKAANRQAHSLNLLSASAFILLLYDPLLLTDVGFQLSYLAVLGLVVVQPVLVALVHTDNKWLNKIWFWCSASIAAQLITFPLSAYYFHQFPLYFLISNLFIIIPSELIMIAGIALLCLSKVPFVGPAISWLLQHLIIWMNKGLQYIEHLPVASIDKLWITPLEYGFIYIILALVIFYLVSKNPWQMFGALTFCLLLCVSVAFKAVDKRSGNAIVFLNLKKHSGIVFKNGTQAVATTDLVPADRNYQYSIQPLMDSLQADSIITISLRQNVRTSYMHKNLNLMQFRNKTVLIFDKHMATLQLNHQLHINYLFVTGSPQVALSSLNKNFVYDTLIIDANNSRQRMDTLVKQAQLAGVKYFCLKRNKSLTIVSN